MNYETIIFETKNNIAYITFNREKVYNALNEKMHEELREVLEIIENDKSLRVLLITANGKAFCTGQDLNDRSVNNADEKIDLGESIERKYNPLIKKIHNLSIPTITYINGICAGAGIGIALACDFTIAHEEVYFLQAFCKIGLVPDSGNTYFLPRLVGIARAKQLVMLGDKLFAKEALSYGLITFVYDKQNAFDEAEKLAEKLAVAPTFGLSLIKKAINQSLDNTLDEQLEIEKEYQRKAGYSKDYKEGVSAFLNKRKPQFQGE